MAEIVICHAPEDGASVRRLADAIAREGYGLSLSDAPSDAVTGQIAEARAAIVVWSEAASASEWVRAEANVARGLKKLIQLSADGRPPPVPFDRARMISILTWKGEDDHPAWRSIKAAIAGLCGPPPERTAAVEPAAGPVVAPAEAPVPIPAPPAEPREPPPVAMPSKGPSALLIVLAVGLALAAVAASAWYWMRGGAPAADAGAGANHTAPLLPPIEVGRQPGAPDAEASAPAPAAFDREAVVEDPVGSAVLRSAPSALGFAITRLDAGEAVATYQQSGEWWQVRTASGRTGYIAASSLRLRDTAAPAPAPVQAQTAEPAPPGTAVAARPARTERRAEPRPRGPRIRKENSEVMVQFCNGAGAGTPQCRRFRQQLRN